MLSNAADFDLSQISHKVYAVSRNDELLWAEHKAICDAVCDYLRDMWSGSTIGFYDFAEEICQLLINANVIETITIKESSVTYYRVKRLTWTVTYYAGQVI